MILKGYGAAPGNIYDLSEGGKFGLQLLVSYTDELKQQLFIISHKYTGQLGGFAP